MGGSTSGPIALVFLWAATCQVSVARFLAQHEQAPAPTAVDKHDKICMASAIALDFEHNRVMDWIAYHHLIGVDCFVLFYDRNHCNLSNARIEGVFTQLSRSDLVTMVNSTYHERLGEETGPSLKQVADMVGGARYMAVVDVDEFIVLHRGYSLPEMLAELVDKRGRLGLFLNRWSFGTNGYVNPVNTSEMPEFYYLTERNGDKRRKKQPRNEPRTGKMIFDVSSGVELWGVHSWHPSATRPDARMVLPDDTELTKGLGQHFINRYKHVQPAWINHYMTGSLNECLDKASQGDHHRSRYEECKMLHPDGKEYIDQKMVQDRDLAARYGSATKKHRDELFPGARFVYHLMQ